MIKIPYPENLKFEHKEYTMVNSKLYCKIHQLELIHNRYIDNNGTLIEIGYCSKCNKEYCEYSDISNIYISNYEWLYNNDKI